MPKLQSTRESFFTPMMLFSLLILISGAEVLSSKKPEEHNAVCNSNEKFISSQTMFFHNESKQQLPECHSIDRSFVQSIIIGDKLQAKTIADMIFELCELSPQINKYIKLVLTHNEGFTLEIGKNNLSADNADGGYHECSKVIELARESKLALDSNFYNLLLHEFRHAAWHTVHQILSGRPSLSSQNYFPETPKEQQKVSAMIINGMQAFGKLWQNLDLEATGKLDFFAKQELKQLRNKHQKEYEKYYKVPVTLTPTSPLCYYLYQQKEKLVIGNTYNLDGIGQFNNLGTFKIKSVNPITIVIEDVLHFSAYVSIYLIHNIGNRYPQNYHLLEIDAHLFGYIPHGIIQHFNPEYYAYTNELFDRTSKVLSFSSAPEITSELALFRQNSNLRSLADTHNFCAEDAKYWLFCANNAASRGHIDEARIRLNDLRNRGYFVVEANLCLANIEYETRNYRLAAKHYKIVAKNKKQSNVFSNKDLQQFADSLEKIGHFKEAGKLRKLITIPESNITSQFRDFK